MNTIVENKSKLDELVQEGYKIIYPNSIDGLDFEVIIKEKHQFSDPTILTPIKESRNCKCFNFYDKFKTSAAKLAETKKNKKQNLESKLEEDLQSLFD